MRRRGWLTFALGILAAGAVQIQLAAAQSKSDGFSDAFFEDIVINGEMTGLWNRAFDRCAAAGQASLEDCVLHRGENVVSHGGLTGPLCVHVSNGYARHYCIVIGSIAADLMVKFELDSADRFIKAHEDHFEGAIDSAGTEVWSYLNRKCASADEPDGCLLDEVSRRLTGSRLIAGCSGMADTHGQVDCLMARWFASQVSVAEMAEKRGASGDFFYNPQVRPALIELARRGRANCDRLGPAAGADCLIDGVAAALPHGKDMKPYCRDIGDSVDRYLCVLTGALATDLYAKIGVGTVETFLKDHGKGGEQAIDRADALVQAFLAEKCHGITESARCTPTEAAARLESDPEAVSLCTFFTEDLEAINCLFSYRALKVLRAAETQL
jgi:hypothetical protein